ncbi:MAG: peptide-methionine (S)-S-oxide reductase MsrA [Actinomycetes bacterium]
MLFGRRTTLPSPDESLSGRAEREFTVPDRHVVLETSLTEEPAGAAVLYLGMGCFWGVEKIYWQVPGVLTTAVGYQGGHTPNATYDEVCSGRTGHTESVKVVYDPTVVSERQLLRLFWENHDPTQGYRQGNDVGTQYRSAIYWTTPDQQREAVATRDAYQKALDAVRLGSITTEIQPAPPFYYAEPYHQQYLAKNPHGYDCHSSTGVAFPD